VTVWTLADMPDLTGRRALVTGVTGGLGEHTVLELARRGCEVVMAARDERKLEATMTDVHRQLPGVPIKPLIVDLADLSSVRRAASLAAGYGPLHLLVNNAGVMAPPYRRTLDGFELQLATNHFGHFALTGLLLPQLVESGDARVVTLASHAHRLARRAPLEDPRTDHGRYHRWRAYAASKLANLLFAFELQRRASLAGTTLTSTAAHPGVSATNLVTSEQGLGSIPGVKQIAPLFLRLMFQSSAAGSQPSLYAATVAEPGSYTGPQGFRESRGHVGPAKLSPLARDEALAGKLWEISEEMTGVRYDWEPGAA
jgi:NAD(P)-dependent dehydrogenase (short-subunit alcohol dehydrogenase family)